VRIHLRDPETLKQVKPLQLVSYLRGRGWKQEIQGEAAETWTLVQEGETFEALVPLDPDLRDYANRIADLLGTLQAVEGRSESQVLSDLLSSQHDVIRLRSVHERGSNGAVPLKFGSILIQRTTDLLLAAACAAVEKRAVFPTRKPTAALDFLDRLLLEQTERGSYVLKILSPVEPLLQQMLPFEEPDAEQPFARRASMVLMQALHATRTAAAKAMGSGLMQPFEEAVQMGVSANLCEAVAALQQESGTNSVEVRMTWSPTRPLPRPIPDRVTLSPDLAPVLQEAGRMLREKSPVDDFLLTGYVVQLRREEQQKEGTATISGLVDGNVRKVAVELDPETYQAAVDAHQQQLPVSCEGELMRAGRGFQLAHPRKFVVLRED